MAQEVERLMVHSLPPPVHISNCLAPLDKILNPMLLPMGDASALCGSSAIYCLEYQVSRGKSKSVEMRLVNVSSQVNQETTKVQVQLLPKGISVRFSSSFRQVQAKLISGC